MAWWSWWVRWTGVRTTGAGEAPVPRTPYRGDPLELAPIEFPARLAAEHPELRTEIDHDGALRVYPTVDDDHPIVVNVPRMAGRLPDPATREERESAYDQWLTV